MTAPAAWRSKSMGSLGGAAATCARTADHDTTDKKEGASTSTRTRAAHRAYGRARESVGAAASRSSPLPPPSVQQAGKAATPPHPERRGVQRFNEDRQTEP